MTLPELEINQKDNLVVYNHAFLHSGESHIYDKTSPFSVKYVAYYPNGNGHLNKDYVEIVYHDNGLALKRPYADEEFFIEYDGKHYRRIYSNK